MNHTKNQIKEESCKVVLVGESAVGKTSIISQITKGKFNANEQITIAQTFSTKILDFSETRKKKLFLEIWDTAGQEKYRSLSKIFYNDANVVIFVYDITSEKSFEEIQNYWIKQVKDYAPKKLVLAIAANKYDLCENEKVNEEDARSLAEKNGAIFYNTSAKNSLGINDLFKEIGEKYLDCFCEEEKNLNKINNRKLSLEKAKNTNEDEDSCCY